jgi:hypothetical protein
VTDVTNNGTIAYQSTDGNLYIELLTEDTQLVYENAPASQLRHIEFNDDGSYLIAMFADDCTSNSSTLEIINIDLPNLTQIFKLDELIYSEQIISPKLSIGLYGRPDLLSTWIRDTSDYFLTIKDGSLFINHLVGNSVTNQSLINNDDEATISDIGYNYPLIGIGLNSEQSGKLLVYDITSDEVTEIADTNHPISKLSLDVATGFIGYTHLGQGEVYSLSDFANVASFSVASPTYPLDEIIFSQSDFIVTGYVDSFTRVIYLHDIDVNETNYINTCSFSFTCYGNSEHQ